MTICVVFCLLPGKCVQYTTRRILQPVQAQEAAPSSFKGGVKFDRADVPRGFALGFTRAAGKSVLTNRPIFSISRPAPEYLPDTRAPREAASRSDGSDTTFGLTAVEAGVGDAVVAEARPELGWAERDGFVTEGARGGMEGDFVALGVADGEGAGPEGRTGKDSSARGALPFLSVPNFPDALRLCSGCGFLWRHSWTWRLPFSLYVQAVVSPWPVHW
jgi:hypothetical protein